MSGELEPEGREPALPTWSVLWLSADGVDPGAVRARCPSDASLRVRRLDRATLVAATATSAVIVVDLASSSAPITPHLELMRQLIVVPLCILSPAQLPEAAQFINAGCVRRILIHPIDDQALGEAIRAAAPPPALADDLIAHTVQASIRALGDLLALAMPEAFGRGQRVARYACSLADDVGFGPTWPLLAASILSQVGMVSLPAELVAKLYRGHSLSAEERAATELMPIIAEEITQGVPYLEVVRRLIRGAFGRDSSSASAAVDVQLLRLALVFDTARSSAAWTWKDIEERLGDFVYWPPLKAALQRLAGREENAHIVEVSLRDVKDGMVLAEDVYDRSTLLLARGHRIEGRATLKLRALGAGKGQRVRVIPTLSSPFDRTESDRLSDRDRLPSSSGGLQKGG